MTKQQDKEMALTTLSELLNPGDTVYCVLRHTAPSGMTRWIDLYVMRDDEPPVDFVARCKDPGLSRQRGES